MADHTSQQTGEILHALPDGDELVERYRPLVNSIVGRILRSLPVQVEFQEAVSYGIIGLLEAAERFDPRRKVSFVTFSYYRIRGSVFDGLREMGILTRTPNDNWVRREVVLNDLVQTAIDDETDRVSGGSLEDEIKGVVKYVDSLVPAYLLSLSAENAPDIADERENLGSSIEFREMMDLVKEAVQSLPEKERDILEALYFKHMTTTDLAAQMGVNKSWVSRLHSKAVQRVRQRLSMKGIVINEI
ncbi:MAG: sigma-70 family RNA polymerase sigma factor [Acidobacteria bacterium]|nr:sigma-70 family RNA polymerase sigma factor [Acidobacteriota bacterium]